MIEQINVPSVTDELAALKQSAGHRRNINGYACRFHHPGGETTTDAELKRFAQLAIKFVTG